MEKQKNDRVVEPHSGEIELYGDPGIASYDAKIPKFLILTYIILPIWGIMTGYYYWNGSIGWLDRGYWHQLQIAANTTLPYENQNVVVEEEPVSQKPYSRRYSMPKKAEEDFHTPNASRHSTPSSP